MTQEKHVVAKTLQGNMCASTILEHDVFPSTALALAVQEMIEGWVTQAGVFGGGSGVRSRGLSVETGPIFLHCSQPF